VKNIPEFLGGSLTSKPTWLHAFGRSITSAFFVFFLKKEHPMAIRNFAPNTKDKSAEFETDVGNAASDVKGKVQELASAVVKEAQDVASDVSHKAQDWAGNVADKAQETAAAVVHKTDDGIAAVGHQMNALGGKLRDAAPHNGTLASAASAVAGELEAGGNYLEGHGLEAISKDLTDVVRKHPIPSLLVGFGIGCLIGMTILQRRS
jgi:ElaB/YqjD/DUF883 family membrane-anchored ribosome-binding protein